MIAGIVASVLLASSNPSIPPKPSQVFAIPSVPKGLYQAYPETPKQELEVTWVCSRLILNRQYSEALKRLNAFEKSHPHSFIPTVGLMFLYHIRMLENFDFHFMDEFRQYERKNNEIIQKNYDEEKATRWQHLMVGASWGLKGMMQARNRHWLKSITHGMKAMEYMERAAVKKEGLPPLYDTYFGSGMFKYWVSWVQQKSLILSLIPDRRIDALRELKICADSLSISSPLASFGLAYLLGQHGRYKDSLKIFKKLYKDFPQNLVLKTLWGRFLILDGQVEAGIIVLEDVLQEEPTYTFVGFHLGRALYKLNREPGRVRLMLEAFIHEENVHRPKIYISQAALYLTEIYGSGRHWEKSRQYLKMVDRGSLSRDERRRYKNLRNALFH